VRRSEKTVIDAHRSAKRARVHELGKQRALESNVALPLLQAHSCKLDFRTLSLFLPALLSAAIATSAAVSRPGNHSASTTVQGQLSASTGKAPVLKTSNKDYQLVATTSYVLHTLQDNRLNGREIRAEGVAKPDGSFEVERFFTIHKGKLYRVRYYCETCNIVALEPGRCECCQQPTELQEVPLNTADQDTITVP